MSYRPERPGFCKVNTGTTLPSGWLWTSGATIGSASSGATALAHARAQALFTHLWTNYANTELAIQDSSGSPTTRGASAAADWAANKRMPTPDYRGRVIAGKDDMGGTAASRLTTLASGINGGQLGASGGAQEVALDDVGYMPNHSHGGGAHTHNVSVHLASLGVAGGGNQYIMNINGGIGQPDNHDLVAESTSVISSEGGGIAHQNTQPTAIATWIIKI